MKKLFARKGGVHAGRIVGGDCHHWNSGGIAVASRATGSRSSASYVLLQQPQATWVVDSQLRIDSQAIPAMQTGSGTIVAGQQRFAMSGMYSLLPFLEQTALYNNLETIQLEPGTEMSIT